LKDVIYGPTPLSPFSLGQKEASGIFDGRYVQVSGKKLVDTGATEVSQGKRNKTTGAVQKETVTANYKSAFRQ